MLPKPEDVDHPLFVIPVSPDTLEYAGSIMQGVGHNIDVGIFQWNVIAPEEGLQLAKLGSGLPCTHDDTPLVRN
jgi:hypothetical protein